MLVLIGAFWHGSGSSGPNKSFQALAEALSPDFNFLQVSRDRAFGASTPAAESGRWLDHGFARAWYCPPTRAGAKGLGQLLRETAHDILMLNGFYDRDFTIPALMLGRFGTTPRKPVILSPRGEFGCGAAQLKPRRKSAWRTLAHRARLLSQVWPHATSEAERADLERGFPWTRQTLIAPNVRRPISPAARRREADPGILRIVFLGRISRVKNLDYALAVLQRVVGRTAFEIFGPIEDAAYWAECRALIASLPANITVRYRGEIANSAVPEILAEADLFFLPSRSENFGHAIFEALSCGVPVLISDTTPWRGLAERAVGWDLPLNDPQAFAARIDAFAAASRLARDTYSRSARLHAEAWVRDSDAVRKSREMLFHVLHAS